MDDTIQSIIKTVVEIYICKKHIEKILTQISEIASEVENVEIKQYLLYPYNELYLPNIQNYNNEKYFPHISENDKKILKTIYDEYICSNELYHIKEIFDLLYNYYLENNLLQTASVLKQITYDLDNNLTEVPQDIDELVEVMF